MSNGRFRSFLTGALVGAGLGILLAPKEGSETRNDLKKSFSLLMDTIKNIDIEETKANLLNKVAEIKDELASIDETTAKELAKEKVEIIKEKCNELIKTAKESNIVVVEKAATEVKTNAVNLLDEFMTEVEKVEKENKTEKKNVTPRKKKTTTPKKKTSTTSKKKTVKKEK